MPDTQPQRDRLTFIVIGILILIFLDRVVMQGDRPYLHPEEIYGSEEVIPSVPPSPATEAEPEIEPGPADPVPEPEPLPDPMTPEEYQDLVPELAPPLEPPPLSPEDPDAGLYETGFSEVEDLRMSIRMIDVAYPPIEPYVRYNIVPRPLHGGNPPWKKNAVNAGIPRGMPKVVIILDDVGVNRPMSEAAIGLPGPLTLAFLPYAEDVQELANEARRRGHEFMVHMPMEPMNDALDPGPDVLRTTSGADTFNSVLNRNLGAIDGYVGINNHMGSKLTQDRDAMARVMGELRERGLLFVDSKTIHSSVAGSTARDFGIPYGVRDVFLDHNPDYQSVMASLQKLESIALEHGSAIAIGHPKPDTIRALFEWLPTLPAKGIALAPVTAVVRVPSTGVVAATSEGLHGQPE